MSKELKALRDRLDAAGRKEEANEVHKAIVEIENLTSELRKTQAELEAVHATGTMEARDDRNNSKSSS